MTQKSSQWPPQGLPRPPETQTDNKHEKNTPKRLKTKTCLSKWTGSAFKAGVFLKELLHNSCINKMGRHRCNKNDDLVFACPSNSSGLRPRLAARPRPRPPRKHVKTLCKWKILTILDQEIRPEVTTSLNKDITFCLKQSCKQHLKIHLKDTQKWPQMAPFWGLGATLEPWRHQSD